MEILLINASPRKNGNTTLLLKHFENALIKPGKNVKHAHLYDLKLFPCTDCRACKKDDLTCIVQDDMTNLYQLMEQADYLVFGSPVYWFNVSGPMKNFIDRLRPYYVNKKMQGKKASIVLVAGSGGADCDLTNEMFKRVFNTLGIHLKEIINAKAYDAGEVWTDTDRIQAIEILAREL